MPAGYAKRVPAGSTLSFSMHYTTNGTPGKDRTKIGLVLATQPPTAEMYMGLINNGLFEIPPGDAEHQGRIRRACFSRTSMCGRFIRTCTCAGRT